MASRNNDKIICPTHITDPASYAVWLDVVYKNGFVDAEEAKSKLFPEAMAERSDSRDSSKRDTHAVSYLDRFGLIHFIDDKQSKFELSSLGLCFYELFEKNDRGFKKRNNIDSNYNSIMLDCLLYWHVSFDENTIFPGQLLLKLLLEPRINKKLSINEFEYTCSMSDYKDTGDYEALVSGIIEFRNSNSELQSASTVERFMTSLINPRSWGVLEKDEDGFCHLNKISESNLSQKLNSNLKLLNSWESGKFIAERSREETTTAYWEKIRISGGQNILLYGVPGSGKSHTIEHELCRGVKKENRYRVVFHPEYMYSDFVGQILPRVIRSEEEGGKDEVSYRFVPGPFTNILNEAYHNPSDKYVLIIEELNRGNAPAIFGEIFQLLDRIGPNSQSNGEFTQGTSEYYINNESIAEYVFGFENKNHPIRIPSNLTILATMNTSDQNVFTLDNAFQRRWKMVHVKNEFKNDEDSKTQSEAIIESTTLSWSKFLFGSSDGSKKGINSIISESSNHNGMSSLEDKRLGCWFVINKNGKITKDDISNKVLKYLWDDAFHLDREVFAEGISSFDELTDAFENKKQLLKDFFIPYKN